MTESPSDLLEVLLLAKETGLYQVLDDGAVKSDLDIVPLLETIDDLKQGSETMKQLFEADVYKKQLQARDKRQEIMLGYSDGSKDGSTLSANWNLFKTQLDIHNVSNKYGVVLNVIQCRSCCVGR